MKKIPLKRRELIALLTHNGFAPGRRGGTSHVHYIGEIDGQKRIVTVDESIDAHLMGTVSFPTSSVPNSPP
ncbi:MAG: type II toxin-antitoxin system HicA family toxin [Dehalococcoidia bacterium]